MVFVGAVEAGTECIGGQLPPSAGMSRSMAPSLLDEKPLLPRSPPLTHLPANPVLSTPPSDRMLDQDSGFRGLVAHVASTQGSMASRIGAWMAPRAKEATPHGNGDNPDDLDGSQHGFDIDSSGHGPIVKKYWRLMEGAERDW